MGRYLDIIRQAEKIHGAYDINDIDDKNPVLSFRSYGQNQKTEPLPYAATLAALRGRCPDHIEPDRWQRAMTDAERFHAQWAQQPQALGWTPRDLFGLHAPPENPHPSYRRLSRYDATGLIWLLEGREVIALTEDTAAIRWPSGGSVTVYRKHNKPALGPLGDSLDDLTWGGH
jgi:hypothetical protein